MVVLALVRRPDAAIDRRDDYRRSIVRRAPALEVVKVSLQSGRSLLEKSDQEVGDSLGCLARRKMADAGQADELMTDAALTMP